MRTNVSGFTLVELVVTIAIVAILTAIALPSFESSLRSTRVATATNELLASLALARSEAIRSTQQAGICASATGTTCGTDWNAGWIVWDDTDANGDPAGETVVRYVQAHPNLNVTNPVTMIAFDSRGRVTPAAADQEFTIVPSICAPGARQKRLLTLRMVGQVTVAEQACP